MLASNELVHQHSELGALSGKTAQSGLTRLNGSKLICGSKKSQNTPPIIEPEFAAALENSCN